MDTHVTCILGAFVHFLPYMVYGSLFDPHVFPSATNKPFFEGWYFRLVDYSQPEVKSFAVLFGKVHPLEESKGQNLAFVGLLENTLTSSRLLSYNSFPRVETVNITVMNGQPVTRDPDIHTQPNFEWRAENGYCKAKDNQIEFWFKVQNTTFSATIKQTWPWSPSGRGPEEWLSYLKYLPVNWFVYSRGADVTQYQWNQQTGGNKVFAHMEKNWGGSFPAAWIWMQGINRLQNASFALTYGPLSMFGVNVTGYLGGYENRNRNIHEDFLPFPASLSHIAISFNGCRGDVALTLSKPWIKLELSIAAAGSSFSECLFGPEVDGFRRVCSESYNASAELTLFRRSLFSGWKWQMIDRVSFTNAALEFGGSYACKSVCDSKSFRPG